MRTKSSRTHEPRAIGAVRIADRRAIPQHWLARLQIEQRDLVRLRDRLARTQPIRNLSARFYAFGADDNRDIVARVDLNCYGVV